MKPFFLFDGAFGTYYHKKNPDCQYPELANLEDAETVGKIHLEYIDSGVNAIKTNTFGANPFVFPDRIQLKKVIQNGFRIAADAAGQRAAVFADIGPVFGDCPQDAYLETTDLFIQEGASNFLFETQHSLLELLPAIRRIKAMASDSIVIVSFAVTQDGYTQTGEFYQTLLEQANAAGADYVGLNCICGPAHLLRLISELDTKKYAVSAMPNAGYPSVVNGRTVYVDNPDYFSDKLTEIYRCGVRAIGGCCGTTPQHMKATAEKLRQTSALKLPQHFSTVQAAVPAAVPTAWDHTIIAVELGAPSDTDMSFTLAASRRMKQAGADFITIPDSPLARARANSMMISAKIQRDAGISAIPHLCCRDRNQIAIKGDLVAAHIEGLREVLAITGDPIPEADRTSVKNVFGFNSYRLIRFISSLNRELFSKAPYRICAALNTSSPRFSQELERAAEKLKNGADCFLTQPLFSEENIQNYYRAKQELGCRILAGIMPLAGYKNAVFLDNEVPGIQIAPQLLSQLRDKSAEEARILCLDYAKGIIDRIKADCDGFYIMTPLKKAELSEQLVRYIREQ